MDARLDRAQGKMQRFGDLLVGEILLVSHENDDPIVRWKRIDQRPGSILFLRVGRDLLGAQPGVLDIDRVFLVVTVPLRQRDGLVLAPADVVDAQPGGNAEQPGRERTLRVIAIQGAEHANEGLLCDVLSILGLTDHSQRKGVDPGLIHLDQLPIGLLISRETPAYESRFRLVHEKPSRPPTGAQGGMFHGAAQYEPSVSGSRRVRA